MGSRPYYPQLDSLRAIAVSLVVLSHFFVGGPWGDYGVRLFFVLSGFLITSIILTAKTGVQSSAVTVGLAARNFYIRRSLRLFPIYYIALAIYFGLAVVTNGELGGIRHDWPYHVSYLTNVLVFFRGEWVGPLSPYWSLGVEEQFYIGWFWLVLFVPLRNMPVLVVSLFLASVTFRLLAFAGGANHYADFLLPACIDTLSAGALLAIATHASCCGDLAGFRDWFRKFEHRLTYPVAALAILLVFCSYGLDTENVIRRLLTNVLSSLVFVFFVYHCYRGVNGSFGRILSSPILVAVGKISYGIYVYHMLVLLIYREFMPLKIFSVADGAALYFVQRVVDFMVPATLTLVVAHLSWHYVESPILRLKGRFVNP